MNVQVQARTSPKQVPNVTQAVTSAVRIVGPVYQSRVPYARALYAAAVAALLAACTPPERAPEPTAAPEQIEIAPATVASVVAGEELPVIIVRASREMPEVVVTASRERAERIG
jgi:hypothetical protein